MLEPLTASDQACLFFESLTNNLIAAPQTLVSMPCPKYALPQVPL